MLCVFLHFYNVVSDHKSSEKIYSVILYCFRCLFVLLLVLVVQFSKTLWTVLINQNLILYQILIYEYK